MKIKVQVLVESDAGNTDGVENIVCLERADLRPESLGLTLAEAKSILAGVQKSMVDRQIEEFLNQEACCPLCGERRLHKGRHTLTYRTLFGKLRLRSARLYHCDCQPQTTKTFSPLAHLLPEHTAPELLYLESKFAALMSYGLSVRLLKEVLPIGQALNATTIRNHVQSIGERIDSELGDEQMFFIDGCERDWEDLPRPEMLLTVGLDGGYVHSCAQRTRKHGWFEVIAGKSVTDDGASKRFAFVHNYDDKPKRRVFEVLRSQGMQINQQVTFLSDGADTVRDLQLYLNPHAEHILDWFHITMRITVMCQMAKGLGPPGSKQRESVLKELERIKWYLWNGNVFEAVDAVSWLPDDIYVEDPVEKHKKLIQKIEEFETYIRNNASLIPNYAERYRYGETISTAFAESTVNQVVSKRMVKKQQMRWSQKGAHLLLQIRTRVLNGELRDEFRKWYQNFDNQKEGLPLAA
jgi:DNA-directed RNA polymerase subunit RPC12/RpoP